MVIMQASLGVVLVTVIITREKYLICLGFTMLVAIPCLSSR